MFHMYIFIVFQLKIAGTSYKIYPNMFVQFRNGDQVKSELAKRVYPCLKAKTCSNCDILLIAIFGKYERFDSVQFKHSKQP